MTTAWLCGWVGEGGKVLKRLVCCVAVGEGDRQHNTQAVTTGHPHQAAGYAYIDSYDQDLMFWGSFNFKYNNYAKRK